MKTMLIVLLLAAGSLVLSNCGGKKEYAESDMKHVSDSSSYGEPNEPLFIVDAAFQQQLAGVFVSYITLKDAFISSDAAKVKVQARTTLSTMDNVDMKLLTGVAHNDWMNYMNGINTSLQAIQASDDIEVQRQAFSTLSDNLYKSIKAYGLGGIPAYYEYCPMAFNNQGGYWLSNEDKIRNPYFGNKMLTCGEVKEKLM